MLTIITTVPTALDFDTFSPVARQCVISIDRSYSQGLILMIKKMFKDFYIKNVLNFFSSFYQKMSSNHF